MRRPWGPGDIYNDIGDNATQSNDTSEDIDFRVDVKLERFRMQIKNGHHFEDDNTSEIRGWYVNSHNDDNSVNGELELNYANVSRSDIDNSTEFHSIQLLATMSQSLYLSHKSFIGAYEYDWYASKKTVTNDCAPWNAKVRMKFSHEFYYTACGIAFLGDLPPPNFISSDQFENSKCTFGLRARL